MLALPKHKVCLSLLSVNSSSIKAAQPQIQPPQAARGLARDPDPGAFPLSEHYLVIFVVVKLETVSWISRHYPNGKYIVFNLDGYQCSLFKSPISDLQLDQARVETYYLLYTVSTRDFSIIREQSPPLTLELDFSLSVST
jgi:hypothetical protein